MGIYFGAEKQDIKLYHKKKHNSINFMICRDGQIALQIINDFSVLKSNINHHK